MNRSPARRKLFLRIFSVLFSLLIWLYVISSAQVEVEKIIPIKLELPPGMALATPVKKELSLFLRGPRVFVRNILDRQNEIEIKEADYYKTGKNQYSVGLSRYQVPLPLGVEQIELVPKKLEFKLEKEISKKVTISPNFDPEALELYDIQKVTIEPSNVMITGAVSIVQAVSKINTTLIGKKLAEAPAGVKVQLKSPHENLVLSDSEVMVNYTLSSKLTEFTFTKIPIIFHSTKLIKTAIPKAVNITVRGDKDLIKKIDVKMIQVVAKVPRQLESKESKVSLQPQLPEGLELISFEPESVTVLTE